MFNEEDVIEAYDKVCLVVALSKTASDEVLTHAVDERLRGLELDPDKARAAIWQITGDGVADLARDCPSLLDLTDEEKDAISVTVATCIQLGIEIGLTLAKSHASA